MSIERHLVDAFKRNDSSLECPPSLDARIMADYGRMAMDKRRNSLMKKKWGLPRVAIIAVIIMVICGFSYVGTKFLFSDSQGNFSIRMQSNEAFSLDPNTLENTRATLKEVQAQLAPGETAVVYLPEVYSKFQGVPVAIGVTNPSLISDAQQWRSVMEAGGLTEPMPDSLLGGAFAFEAGTTNSPFRFQMGLEAFDKLNEMKLEYKQGAGQQPLWRLTDAPADHPIFAYTSVYRDSDGESIYLTWELINDTSIKLDGFTSPNTVYEEIDLNGKKVHYTKNNQSFYGESNTLQNVMWILEKNGQTIVHHVESDSASMTKEQLIEAAQSLL